MTATGAIDLASARARLAELDGERAALRKTIAALERNSGGPDITTAAGRVTVFTSLFRGRPDVFATRWESTRAAGRSGWAPKCSNEWEPGLCFKPKVRCAACSQRRFVPFSPAEARLHLEGRQTAGIYPLLEDETCWLVAIDLDGATWPDDVGALRDAARDMDVPVMVERSRSGLGAHLWVLFSTPVPARSARAVGMTAWREECVRTRGRRLVAPPLGARAVEARLAGRVEVGCAGLPASLRDRLRRTAAFANPEFFERERSRLSTHKTPRVIACHEEITDRLLLPRGCLGRVEEELAAAGLDVRVRDDRADGDAISVAFTGTLTRPQQAAVDALAVHEIG
ncbi:MAG: TOTE conflict system archaeo-eukaryotic primase domain-containing protein, partial [Solirubrobacteraceae bacterium]